MTTSYEQFFEYNKNILIEWRELLWESGHKRSTVLLLPYIKGIYPIKSNLDVVKEFVDPNVYENTIKEYNMTIYLLYKCLIKIKNRYSSTIAENDMIEIDNIMKDLLEYIRNGMDMDTTVSLLRQEDKSTQKVLKEMGLPLEKIQEIIAAGHCLPSVLDEELDESLKM